MLLRRTLALASTLTVALINGASAQTCGGFASFSQGPFQVAGGAAFNDNSKSFGGGFAFGGSRAFGEVNAGTVKIDAFDASSFTVGGGAGLQVALDPAAKVHLCPIGRISFAIGPNNIQGTDIDYSETDVVLGLSLGIVASSANDIQVIPNGSVSFASATGKLKDSAGNSLSETQSFGIVGLGIGFVLSRTVTLHPNVSIPFGLDGASTSFGGTVAINFGTPSGS